MDLITGGTGFIGSTLAKELLEMGEDIGTFDIKSSSPLLEPNGKKWTHFQGNLGNLGEVLTTIYHSSMQTKNRLSPGWYVIHSIRAESPGFIFNEHCRDLQCIGGSPSVQCKTGHLR